MFPFVEFSYYFRSTLQVPPIRRPAIDYPSSTSRIEEVPNYDLGSVSGYQSILMRCYVLTPKPKGHSQQVQFQGTGNQQTHSFMPQVTAQPVASSSYQQSNPQQWIPGNSNSRQSTQYSPYSQQPTMQSGWTSYTPFSFSSAVRPQQLPPGQDQGSNDNHPRPVVPKQEQRRVPSDQKPVHYGSSGSSQGQWETYSPPQTIPAHAPGPSSQAAYKGGPSQNRQQSSRTNMYSEATVSQSQATASVPTHFQGPLPHKTINTASELATALGPQPNTSSSVSVRKVVAYIYDLSSA
jgi:hypothetical protein